MKWYRSGVSWGKNDRYIFWWNFLPRKLRYWGFRQYNFNGLTHSFGLWFTNITWRFL